MQHSDAIDVFDDTKKLRRLLKATEDVLDFKIVSCKISNLPNSNCRQIEMDLSFSNRHIFSLEFIEYHDLSRPSKLTSWSANSNLARAELTSTVEELKENLPLLFTRLAEYSQLAEERLEMIREFSNAYNEISLFQPMPDCILLEIKDLLKITWTFRFCNLSKQIVNDVQICVHKEDEKFIEEAGQTMEILSDICSSSEDRRKSLMHLGLLVNMYL